jgi:hypothetical protein
VASKKEKTVWMRLFSVTIDRDRITAWEKDLDHTSYSSMYVSGLDLYFCLKPGVD